jgi:hypothetical protein
MIERLARATLPLYPLGFRRRYEPEMLALLEDQPVGALGLLDLVWGAVRAHIRPPGSLAAQVSPEERARLSASGVLLCWVLFAAAGFGYYKTTEDVPFSRAGHAHALLGVAHAAVQALALIGSGAVLLGAGPLIALALARARREPVWRRVVWRAVWPVLGFLGLSAGVVVLAHSGSGGAAGTSGHGLGIAWSLLGLGCGVACGLACRRALLELEVPARWLRNALVWATVAAATMGLMAVMVAIYAAGLLSDAAGLASVANGPFGLVSVGVSLIAQLAAMTVLGALAAAAAVRGWRRVRQPGTGDTV